MFLWSNYLTNYNLALSTSIIASKKRFRANRDIVDFQGLEGHMTKRLTRQIGSYTTSAVGLGTMGLAIEGKPSAEESIDIIHQALDAGCRHIDTAWAYYQSGGQEEVAEMLVRQALDSWDGPRKEVMVATKAGHYRNFTDSKPTWAVDGRPESLIRYAKQSAQTLGVDTIDLLYFHRPDPQVPYEESIQAMKEIYDQGLAASIGISNVSCEQIDIARTILGPALVAVQNQFSPIYRETQDTLDYTAQLGLAFVCWSPLGGFRKPYDQALFDPFRTVAAAHQVSYQQIVLAWELARGTHVFVLPGTHRASTFLDSLAADQVELTEDELAYLG